MALIAGLIAAPWWGTTANLRLITEFMFYVALASLCNLLAGCAAPLCIGQHACVGMGGDTLFSVTLFVGVSPL